MLRNKLCPNTGADAKTEASPSSYLNLSVIALQYSRKQTPNSKQSLFTGPNPSRTSTQDQGRARRISPRSSPRKKVFWPRGQSVKMDWLAPLQTFGTSYLYPTLKFVVKLCYIVTIPLHYPLYYLLALVAFLLSPIWHMVHGTSRAILAVASLVAKLKVLLMTTQLSSLIAFLQ